MPSVGAASAAAPGPSLAAPVGSNAGDRTVAQAAPVTVKVDEERVLSAAKAALAEQPVAQSAGAGRVGGRVFDYLDRPVSGVQVALEPAQHGAQEARSLGSLGGLSGPGSLEEQVLDSAERWAQHGGVRQVLETDASGAFEFSGLPEGLWSIEAGLVGWKVDRVNSRPRTVQTGAMVDFEAVPRIPVTIDVLGLAGEALEEATLELHVGNGNASHYSWTRELPELNLAPGTYRVRAISTPQACSVDDGKWMSEAASEELELSLVVGDAQRTEVLQLVPRTGIFGQVQLPREPLEGNQMMVRLVKLGEGVEAELSSFRNNGDGINLNDDTTFGFMDLEPGSYAVGFVRGWREEALVMETVEVTQGLTEVELVVDPPEPKRTLTALVLDAGGRPLQDVRFQMRRQVENGSNSGNVNTDRLPEGGYELTLDEDEERGYWERDGEIPRFFLTATSSSQGGRRVELSAGQESIEIRLDAPAELEVRIMGYDADRYGGRVTLSLTEVSEDGSTNSFSGTRGKLDAAGVQRFEGLGPGKKRIYLNLQRNGRGWGRGGGPLVTEEVIVEPGFNRATIALPALAELRVRAPELQPGSNLSLAPEEGGSNYSARLSEDHIALFEDIPHGDYTLTCWGVSGTMDVRVPSSEVQWEPRAPKGMRIQSLASDHPLRAAGLAEGDVLLEIDGEAVAMNTLWSKFYALSVASSSTAAVLYARGSQRLTAELSGAQIDRDSIGQGVTLVPVYD